MAKVIAMPKITKAHERLLGEDAEAVRAILAENEARNDVILAKFNPITGEGSIGQRTHVTIKDFPFKEHYLPDTMMKVPLIKKLVKAGSIKAFFNDEFVDQYYTEDEKQKIIKEYMRVRIRHDFPFWAASLAYISPKEGGDDILFRLNRAQRKLVKKLEKMRLAGKPIRLVLLKARQWGGSTCIQLYMAWLQLVHNVGVNSLIIAHQTVTSDEINDMFKRMIDEYPLEFLHNADDEYSDTERKYVGVGKSGLIHRVPQRKCKIKIGTAENPRSCRGGGYSLVHLSEVALWKDTDKITPEKVVNSALSGVLYKPMTLIAYESTANGTGNLFHKEYLAAKNGQSQFEALFIAWFEIDQYSLSITEPLDAESPLPPIVQFAHWLYRNRNIDFTQSDREEPGSYLWKLWQDGATLEAINWYIAERTKYTSHASMASEYPSDDIEAFTYSGRKVFDMGDVEKMRGTCKPPKFVGEIYGRSDEGEDALQNIRFKKEKDGRLWMWQDVEIDEDEEVTDRYLVVVDVCKGHTAKADFAVILVIDRLYMIDGLPPSVVAQWYGHIDMDLLAWKATQIAQYYNEAKLVIESNTLETNNTKGDAEYILNLIREVYDNLYARKQSAEDIREKAPLKYGFHTNTLTKKVIINNLKKVVREQLYIERDEGCLDEYATYIETDNGGYEAMTGYHDDKLMTRAIGMHVCLNEMPLPTIVKRTTLAQRRAKRRKKTVTAAII